MNQDYDSIYQKLQPALEQLEARRLILKAQGTRTGLITGGILLLIGIILTLIMNFQWVWVLISLPIGLIALFLCISAQSKTLTAFYKKEVITKIITDLCSNAVYAPEQGIPEPTFRVSGLFVSPDRYHSEDLITGKIDKTSFFCSEIVAEEKKVTVDSKGRRQTRWIDIFRGFLFIADFQKDFQGQTVIYRNSWFKWGNSNQRIVLENPGFEKNFDVYSSDQVEARYLITPGFMEKLMELDRKFPGKITVSFLNSNVIIAIPDSGNHFETSIWQSQTKNHHIKSEFYTLSLLFGIVDDLNLNLRIWSKE